MRVLPTVAMLLLASPFFAQSAPKIDSDYEKEMSEWRQRRLEGLKKNWVSLAGLYELKPGANEIGSDLNSHVVLTKACACAPKIGVIEVQGGKITMKVAEGTKATIDGKPFTEATLIPDDPGPPTAVSIGTLRMHVIKRNDSYFMRIKDLESPDARTFKPLEYFPLRQDYIVTAEWVPLPGKKIMVPNILGHTDELDTPGEARFTLNGKKMSLRPMQDGDELFFVISDQTAGKETYAAGRFLYADAPKDGKVLLDFNKAYSPPCAFTPYATCPLPPKENKMQARVEAGEKFSKH